MRACPQCGTEYSDEVPYCQKDGTQLTETDRVDDGVRPAGSVIGSYRLIRLLGEGGMGYVYLAEHTRLGRKVAIKMLRSRYSTNPVAIKRFFREARSVNQINHENIVEITDFIEKEGEDNYYIMELLQGQSVGEIIEQDGYVPLARSLAIITQVCDALAAVHDADIVHRDLKPDNVYLIRRSGRDDFVKLLDFGVAKLEDPVEAQAHQTAGGAILGTPEYMSPEQASSKAVDYRTDIYALGVIMYEMLTGQQPFTGQSYGELVIKHVTIPPTPPSQLGPPQAIPPEIEELILQCLEKDPEARPRHMQEILVRLGQINQDTGDQPVPAPPPPVAKSGKPVRLITAGVGLLALLGLILAIVFTSGPDTTEKDAQAAVVQKPEPVADAGIVPAKPEKIKVAFESVPPGASITRNGSKQPLGTTPVSLDFKPSPDPETFEFRLAGYLPVRQEISLKDDNRVVAKLTKVAKRKRRKKTRKKKRKKVVKKPVETKPTPEDLGGTLDPFRKK